MQNRIMFITSCLLTANLVGMQKPVAADAVAELSKSIASSSISEAETDREVVVKCDASTMTDPIAPRIVAAFSPKIKQHFIDFVNNEKSGIDAAFYRFTLYDVAEAIVNRKKSAGISVDLVVNSDYKKDFCEGLKHMAENGVAVSKPRQRHDYSGGYETMHHKFAIFKSNVNGGEVLWTGSYNMTGAAEMNNWENVTLTTEPEVIAQFKLQFGLLKTFCTKIEPSDLISEKTSTSKVSRRINGLE